MWREVLLRNLSHFCLGQGPIYPAPHKGTVVLIQGTLPQSEGKFVKPATPDHGALTQGKGGR